VDRLIQSSNRLCIPPLDPELALRSLVTLVGIERGLGALDGGNIL